MLKITQRGFTLVELIAVMLVIAIGAVYVAAHWPGHAVNLRAAADRLVTEIEHTQQLSMNRHQHFRMDFSNINHYTLRNAAGTEMNFPVEQTGTAIVGPDITVTLNNTSKYVAFDGIGTPLLSTTAGGTGTPITTALTITVQEHVTPDAYTHTITIEPTTGQTTLQ